MKAQSPGSVVVADSAEGRMRDWEAGLIRQALERHRGNISLVARELGVSQYDLPAPARRIVARDYGTVPRGAPIAQAARPAARPLRR